MKKLFDILAWTIMILCVIWFHTTYAADWGAPTGNNRIVVTAQPETYITILDASPAAATGLSARKDFGMTPRTVTCTVKYGGTAPTSWTFEAQTGPADSSANMTMPYPSGTTSTTVSTFPGKVSFLDGYTDRYWRIKNLSTVGGAADTTYSVVCTGMK